MTRAHRQYFANGLCDDSYEFYRAAPDGVTFMTTNLAVCDARESTVGGFKAARVETP